MRSGAASPTLGVDYDEYGNPADGQARRYGWLGSKQRSGDDLLLRPQPHRPVRPQRQTTLAKVGPVDVERLPQRVHVSTGPFFDSIGVGLAYSGGGSCGMRYNLQIACGGSRWGYARGGTTSGNTFVFGQSRHYIRTQPELLRHEYVHSRQRARYGLAFPFLYFDWGTNPARIGGSVKLALEPGTTPARGLRLEGCSGQTPTPGRGHSLRGNAARSVCAR